MIPPWQAGLVVQAIAIDDVIGTLRATTLPSKRIVFDEVNPNPSILAVDPTGPADGETE